MISLNYRQRQSSTGATIPSKEPGRLERLATDMVLSVKRGDKQMPEYTQIQTYIACNKDTFSEVVPRFQQVLDRIHGFSPEVQDWLSHLDWPSWEEGYSVYSPTFLLQSQDQTFSARPYMLFPMSEKEERWADWVELGIYFGAEPLREINLPVGPCKVQAGYFIWSILEAFALTFLENGVYFTDELQDGRAGEVLMERKGNFWIYSPDPIYPLFDAAILPLKLVKRFEPVPEVFAHVNLPQAVGVAAKDRFLSVPWNTKPL